MINQQTANTNQPATLNPDVYLGETAYLMGMSYFNYVDRYEDLDSRLHKVKLASRYQHGFSLIRPQRNADGSLPNGGNINPAIPAVHMPYNGYSIAFNASLHPDSGDVYNHTVIDWWYCLGLQASAAEHGVLLIEHRNQMVVSVAWSVVKPFHII